MTFRELRSVVLREINPLGRTIACAALGGALLGCATQQATSQALTIAGAAAVIVGASMAANNDCSQITPEGAGPAVCSGGLSRGARNAGTALAVAGAGVAAAGYALQPKGPDRLQGSNALPAPAAPYRLVRRAPPEVSEPEQAAHPQEEPDCSVPARKPSREETTAEAPIQPSPAPPCSPTNAPGEPAPEEPPAPPPASSE